MQRTQDATRTHAGAPGLLALQYVVDRLTPFTLAAALEHKDTALRDELRRSQGEAQGAAAGVERAREAAAAELREARHALAASRAEAEGSLAAAVAQAP